MDVMRSVRAPEESRPPRRKRTERLKPRDGELKTRSRQYAV